jgi:proline iminopeptidase
MWTPPWGGSPVPTLLLTTTGRKSKQRQVLPLIYGKTDKGYAIVASKGGAPSHPAWYLNLSADPDVEVQVGSEKFAATARTVSGAERAALWKQMAALFPPYDEYQRKTRREIPVVVLEPIDLSVST